MDHRPPGSSVHRILQGRILEWIAMFSPGDLLNPGINPVSFMSHALGEFFATSATWEALLSLPTPVKKGVWGKTKWKENQNETR